MADATRFLPGQAAAVVRDRAPQVSPRVALVLGSGGARGLAHIGVIEALVAAGFEISYISGCSMGALVGGIYAAGKLDVYSEWVSGLERRDVLGLLDLSFGLQGLFKGERIIGKLKEMIGDRNIEQLDIGYTAVAKRVHRPTVQWTRVVGVHRAPLVARPT